MKTKILLFVMGLILTTQLVNAQVPSYVPTNGLVAHYPFNGNANDESGNAHNGTVMNGAALTADRFGNENKAYSFDGVNDYVSANIGSLQAITLSVWINSSEPVQYYPIVAMYAQYMAFIRMSGNNPIYISNGTVGDINTEYLPATPNFIGTNFNLSFDSWHHIVVVFDNSVGKYELYVDNNLIGSAVTTGPVAPTSSTILFGNSVDGIISDGGAGFKGSIDDVDIWNRALSPQEITSIYNQTPIYSETCNNVSGSLTQGLVGYWPFCGNANDDSGNGYNGTVNGATLTEDRFGNSNSAYNFDGVNDFISTSYSGILGNNSRSISFWYNGISNNIGETVFTDYGGGNNNGEGFACTLFPLNQPAVDNTGSWIKSVNSTTINNWNFYTVTYSSLDGSNLDNCKIYINGVLQSTSQSSPVYDINTINGVNMVFGSSRFFDPIQFFNGKLDDIGIWNRALTQQEITQLFNQNQCQTNITVTDTLIINVGQLSYTNPVSFANNITIYPNPASTQVNISFNNITDLAGGSIKIINSLGQQVATTPITATGTNTTMALNSWGGTGLYFVQILNAQGQILDIKKIILQ